MTHGVLITFCLKEPGVIAPMFTRYMASGLLYVHEVGASAQKQLPKNEKLYFRAPLIYFNTPNEVQRLSSHYTVDSSVCLTDQGRETLIFVWSKPSKYHHPTH